MTSESVSSEYRLQYFPMRGRGEPIRLMLELNQLSYTEIDVHYSAMKRHAGMSDSPFGQVPLLINGDKTVAQMDAILSIMKELPSRKTVAPEVAVFGRAVVHSYVPPMAHMWIPIHLCHWWSVTGGDLAGCEVPAMHNFNVTGESALFKATLEADKANESCDEETSEAAQQESTDDIVFKERHTELSAPVKQVVKRITNEVENSSCRYGYLGRRHGMYCGSPEELAEIDEMLSGLEALRQKYYDLAYVGQFTPEAVRKYERDHMDPNTRTGDNQGAHMFFIYQLFLRSFAGYEKSLNIGHVQLYDIIDLHLRRAIDWSRNFEKWYPEFYKEIPMNDRAEMKANAGMEYPFGQVPILKKDGRVMAQSGAILRYLGRRHGMYDGSPEELEAIDEMIAGVDDLRAQYHPLVYVHRLAPDYLKEYIAKHIDPKGIHEDNKGAHMAFLNKLFEKHFARYDDSSLNIGHVKLFDVVDTHLRGALNPSSQFQEWYPELVKFHAYFADLPMIRTYLGSERRHVDINANKLG
ncbi:hypothetical protein FOL47_002386 [Perkinsus chesapeaki]|uniref:glutathione transferase n=1 Tax=Perkinsus chesapeaki TaxID=330153 RepID=A0A7J6ME95_PERCH|nr:hypothetical protein FOL47_002386 [Perkinsus chesapeaki]